MKLFNHRRSYKFDYLNIDSIGDNPIDLFAKWFKEAESCDKIIEPNAMTISTVNELNKPSSRIVLLKEFSDEGFIFFTNYQSKKAKSIKINKMVSLSFFWQFLERQVIVNGTGDVLEPEGDVIGIGSGGNYALAAGKVLMDTDMSAEEVAKKAIEVASEICVFTNDNIKVLKI